MRHFLSLIGIGLLASNLSYSQTATTIFTPRGSTVPDTYILPEMSSSQISSSNNYFSATYPNATRLANASQTYNCHSYAWHKSEGGNTVWIGAYTTTAEDVYWNDGSYIQVCSQTGVGGKVSVASDNHSAVTTSQANTFISKWGNGPLMQHASNYMPYNYSTLKYYVKTPSISGSASICGESSQSYSVNLPTGASVTWSVSGNLTITGSTTANPVSIAPINVYNEGSGTITATISTGCGVGSSVKTITIGSPEWVTNFNDIPDQPSVGMEYWVSENNPYPGGYQHIWSVYPESGASVMNFNGVAQVIFNEPGTYYLSCELLVSGQCVSSVFATKTYDVQSNYYYAFSPNPTSTELTVSRMETNSTNTSVATHAEETTEKTFEVKLFNNLGEALRTAKSINDSKITLDVSNIPNGTYFLHISDGKKKLRKQVIIKH